MENEVVDRLARIETKIDSMLGVCSRHDSAIARCESRTDMIAVDMAKAKTKLWLLFSALGTGLAALASAVVGGLIQ